MQTKTPSSTKGSSKNKDSTFLEDIKQKKSRKFKFMIFGGLVLILIVFIKSTFSSPDEVVDPEYVTVERGEITTTITEDGSVKSPRILSLSFDTPGKIAKILVKEGEKVFAQQALIKKDTTRLWLNYRSAEAKVKNFQAQIIKKKSETVGLQTKSAEQKLQTEESVFESSQRQTNQAVDQSYDNASLKISTALNNLNIALDAVDDVYKIDNKSGKNISSVLGNTVDTLKASGGYSIRRDSWRALSNIWQNKETPVSHEKIRENLTNVILETEKVSSLLLSTSFSLQTAQENHNITSADIAAHRNAVRTVQSSINATLESLRLASQNIDASLVNQQNKLSDANARIQQSNVLLENEREREAQIAVQKQEDLDILNNQLAVQKIQLADIKYDIDQSTIVAPTNGRVTEILKNVGEIGSGEVMQMISDDNFTIDILVEELSIAKVYEGQEVNILIPALPEAVLRGNVTLVSQKATIGTSGIVKYLVRITIEKSDTHNLREGMTASVEFIIAQKLDVLKIRAEAFFQEDDKYFVRLAEGGTQEVSIGIQDSVFVEILSGLNEGQEVILNHEEYVESEAEEVAPKKLSQDFRKDLQEGGFTPKEIKDIESGNINPKLKQKMKEWSNEQKRR